MELKTKDKPSVTKIIVSGELTRIESITETPISFARIARYAGGCSVKETFLNCTLIDENGKTVYFKSPSVRTQITNGGNFASVSIGIPKRSRGWFEKTGENKMATPGNPSDHQLRCLINRGDRITISGRSKEKISSRGNRYIKMTHVELIK